MTAATHPVELCIPGTLQDYSFDVRCCRPSLAVPVTDAARRRIAAEISLEQKLWSLLVVATCMGFAVIVSFSLSERELAGMQWEAARPIWITGLISLVYLHLYFRRQRRFVMTAPVAVADVVERRLPRYGDEEMAEAVPRLLLRYVPQGETPKESAEAHMLWAELDGFSARFERTAQAGDRVSILYDVGDPRHVRVVQA